MDNHPFEKSQIDDLERELYKRDPKISSGTKAPDLKEPSFNVRPDWEQNTEEAFANKMRYKLLTLKQTSIAKKVFVVALIFFVAAAGFAYYSIYRGSNVVSSDNVTITVAGPLLVAGGEVLPLEVIVTNENNAALQDVGLDIAYPNGTRQADDLAKELSRYHEDLGGLSSGESVRRKTSAAMFGEEGTKKEITLSLEYRIAGSNAIFYKEKKYEVIISSAPVSMTVDMLKEINSGKDFDITVTVTANSTSPVKDVLVSGEYGLGFNFKNSDPAPLSGDNLWRLGDLAPGGKRTIVIRGNLEGQDGEDRVFRFSVGGSNTANPRVITVPFLSQEGDITIKKPFIGIDLSLNGESSRDITLGSGQDLRGIVTIMNNLPNRVISTEVEVKITGGGFDQSSVSPSSGIYKAGLGTINWDERGDPDLSVINPGDAATVDFSLKAANLSSIISSALRNQSINFSVTVRAKRFSESRVPEEVTTNVSRMVKLKSDVTLKSELTRHGPFAEHGPIPPRAEQETTYTVIWSLANSLNNISNAEIRATLPQYVRYVGSVNPPGERVSYNNVTGEVVWLAGDVPAGMGFGSSPKQLAFQVALTPGTNQIGKQPVILGPATFSAFDRFTENRLIGSVEALTTRFAGDADYKNNDDTVKP